MILCFGQCNPTYASPQVTSFNKQDLLYLYSKIPQGVAEPHKYIFEKANRLEWRNVQEWSFADLNKRNEVWIRLYLPNIRIDSMPTVFFQSFSNPFTVYLDSKSYTDKPIYEYMPVNGRFTYGQKHYIKLPDDYPGKMALIHIEYDNPNDAFMFFDPHLGNYDHLVKERLGDKLDYIRRNIPMIIVGSIATFIGLALILISLSRRANEYTGFLYLGLFALTSGLQHLFCLTTSSEINLQPSVYFTIEHLLRNSFLIFLSMFLEKTFGKGKTGLISVIWKSYSIYTVIEFFGFIYHPLPRISNIVFAVIVLLVVIASFDLAITNKKFAKSKEFLPLLAMGILIITGIHDTLGSLMLLPWKFWIFGWGIIAGVLIFGIYLEKSFSEAMDKMKLYSKELEIKQNELIRLQKENLQTQFESLRNQVNPHFLFNSLNVLTSLIKIEPDLAEKFTEQLSKTYRYVLEHRSEDLVMLRTEIEFLSSYTFLLNIRFMEKLFLNVNCEEENLNKFLPPLTLQMLIENAIKHNTFSKKSPLYIDIFCDNDGYAIVQNNLQQRDIKIESTGLGLRNIMDRYSFFSDKIPYFGINNGHYIAKVPLIDQI